MTHYKLNRIWNKLKQTASNDIVMNYMFLKRAGFDENSGKYYMSESRLQKNRSEIIYLLGQLYDVHNTDALDTFHLDIVDLQTKYDGTRWTQDPNFAIFLYILGNAGFYFAGFEKEKDGIYRTDLREAPEIIEPLESPNDPNLVKRFPK